jgi:asparagine synthase (glutamine-hydrolysing)
MCGIFGLNLSAMQDDYSKYALLLKHRGPDAFGSYINREEGVYLGHCRLAIIDLSEAGNQPMCNEDETVWLSYNGEIYNFQELRHELIELGHIFKSKTDSEVIIHGYEEWGADCVNRFNGMFAFALWDEKKKHFFLARDRLGIKPLYYADLSGGFAFASEPKALIDLPFFKKAIHYPALFSYLIYRYIEGSASIWKGIERLRPGHYLVYDLASKSIITERYWKIPLEQKNWDETDAIECLSELLKSSVSYRLISDVPIGIFLSGGIDSSTITAFASIDSTEINTFSIGFDGSTRSELNDALVVAEHFQTRHHEDIVGSHNIDSLDKLFDYYDEPLGDSSIIPTYLLCSVARKYATVALAGDGGDELFGGYSWYDSIRKYGRWGWLSWLFSPISGFLGGRGQILAKCGNEFNLYRQLTSPRFDLDRLRRLFPEVNPEDFPESENYLFKKHFRRDLEYYKRWQYLDAVTFMTDDILTKVDRSSMAHSLEVRVPFLDHRIVEFAFSLPDDFCIRKGQKKYLLHLLLKDIMPKSTLQKPKQGFSCPVLDYWPTARMIEEIENGVMLRNGLISRKEWSELAARPNSPNWEGKIWLLAVLEKWSERWLFN